MSEYMTESEAIICCRKCDEMFTVSIPECDRQTKERNAIFFHEETVMIYTATTVKMPPN